MASRLPAQTLFVHGAKSGRIKNVKLAEEKTRYGST
jgi:hypothetical protein